MATKVAEGAAEFSVINQPAKDGLAEVAKAAEETADRMVAADEKATRAAEKAAERRVRADERAAERKAKAEERAAERAAIAVERETARKIRSEEKAAAAAAKNAEKMAGGWRNAAKQLQQNQLVSEAETLASLFIQVGGSVSQVASIITSSIRPAALFATTLGGVTLAAAAAPVALGGMAYAIKAVTEAGIEARDRLDELGRGAEVARESRVAFGEYESAVRELDVALDALTVSIGTEAAPAATRLMTSLRLLIEGGPEFGTMLRQSSNDGRMLADVLEYLYGKTMRAAEAYGEFSKILMTGGASLLMDAVGAEADAYADAKAEEADAEESLRRARTASTEQAIREAAEEEQHRSESARRAAGAVADARRKEAAAATEAARKAAEADRKAARARMEAEREAAAESARVRAELMVDIDARTQRTEELIALTKELRDASVAADEAAFTKNLVALWAQSEQAGRAAVETQALVDQELARSIAATDAYAGSWEQIGDVIKAIAPDVLDLAQVVGSTVNSMLGDLQTLSDQRIQSLQETAEAEVAAAVDAAERWAEGENNLIDMMEERGQLSEQEAAAERRRVDENLAAKKKAADDLAADERKAAMEAFRRSQSLAGTQAAIAAALSAVALIPSLAYLGWGAPFAAAGLAGGALATQIAVINSQQPPEFPMGLRATSPDHPRLVAVQDGEPVLPRRSVDLLGGPTAVDRLIAGQRPGGQGPVNVYLGRRLLAQAIEETTPSKPLDPRTGRRDPWKRP